MKLISMTDFVLEQYKINQSPYNFWKKIGNYANFLKQPLELWMFVPCDENGNVLEVPKPNDLNGSFFKMQVGYHEEIKYQQAKERCLFEGFIFYENKRYILFPDNATILYGKSNSTNKWNTQSIYFNTIEDLVKYNLELTQTAQKQIGL